MNNVYPIHTNIIDIISSLPGISNVTSNLNNFDNKDSILIFFNVSKTDKGLFLLTRCCDRRYWRYGDKWTIELIVGDTMENNILPITYVLNSGDVKGDEAINQSFNLMDNINHHLNHDAFLYGYNLDRNLFLKSYISYERKKKLKNIELYEKILESKG